jgi:hypothetical protein
MGLSVQEFHTGFETKISDNPYASELFTRLRQWLAQLDAHATAHSRNTRAFSESVTNKQAAQAALRVVLESVNRTIKPLEKTMPGIVDKFRIPARLKDQDLLIFARAVAVDAAPIKAELIKRGLSATIIEDITAAAAAFEQAVGRRIQSKESRIASGATVKKILKECMSIVRELDPIVRNIFADDVAALAAWESASRVERAARRTKSNAPPSTQTPAPAH